MIFLRISFTIWLLLTDRYDFLDMKTALTKLYNRYGFPFFPFSLHILSTVFSTSHKSSTISVTVGSMKLRRAEDFRDDDSEVSSSNLFC